MVCCPRVVVFRSVSAQPTDGCGLSDSFCFSLVGSVVVWSNPVPYALCLKPCCALWAACAVVGECVTGEAGAWWLCHQVERIASV
jgi:hypothetical protein